jgi:serine/threonine-protein kinase
MKPGAVLASRYTIEKEIGRGGMGSVYRARDGKFGARVALKVASASGVTLDEFRARFAREARIGHRLGKTEGFVRVLDFGEVDDATLYLAMDLVEDARPLDLVSGSLPERVERLARAAKLVAAAHALGVVHRDLKPENFLVDASGRIHLSDFGLAKSHEADEAPGPGLTRTGLGMGTPTFMPPEQFEDTRGVDERADVYALGVMLFLALTGKLPYEGSATAILSRHVRIQGGLEPPPRPGPVPGAPATLLDLCARAIALDRNARLASAALLAQGLGPEASVARVASVSKVSDPEPRAAVRPVAPPTPPPSSHVRPVAPPPEDGARRGSSPLKIALIVAFIVGCMLLLCVLSVGLVGLARGPQPAPSWPSSTKHP